MSRVIVYGLDNKSVGEFNAIVPRGWMVDGSRSVSGGGQTSTSVSAETASKPWLQLGRMVMVPHPKLPNWCGMIDTPWKVTLPVGLTLYNPAYLLSLRTPDAPEVLMGDVYHIAAQMIERINAQEEMFLRLGNISSVDITRQETLDQRSYWEQLNALVARAGKELYLRPVDESGRLIIYVDILDRVGIDTGFLLHDGENANIQVADANLNGKIINRLIGISSQSAVDSRLATGPQFVAESIAAFRLRSAVTQYQNVGDDTTLLTNTLNDLNFLSWPRLKIPVLILDVGETFNHLRPGNSYILHVSKNLYLPGGTQGWRGVAHLTALAYDESNNTVGGMMEAAYVPEQ